MFKKFTKIFKKKDDIAIKVEEAKPIPLSEKETKVVDIEFEEIEEEIKEEEEVIEEAVEEIVEEEVVEETVEEIVEEEKVIDSELEEIEYVVTAMEIDDIEVVEVNKEDVKSYDVDTAFRFEVYVGLDNENNVELMNEKDFDNVESALKFAEKCIDEMFNDDELHRVIAFVHEEVKNEHGEKTLTRYMI